MHPLSLEEDCPLADHVDWLYKITNGFIILQRPHLLDTLNSQLICIAHVTRRENHDIIKMSNYHISSENVRLESSIDSKKSENNGVKKSIFLNIGFKRKIL